MAGEFPRDTPVPNEGSGAAGATFAPDLRAEWLETDGLGGFSSGTVGGVRTRRYHATLIAATTPPTGRVALVSGFDAWVVADGLRFPISAQRYVGAARLEGQRCLEAFALRPWPTWTYRIGPAVQVIHELFANRGAPRVVLSWRLARRVAGTRLVVRPFLSARDYHALRREDPAFCFSAEETGCGIVWRPYDALPPILARTNGRYRHEPYWYREFLYEDERDRGFDAVEDLGSPGEFEWSLSRGRAVLILEACVDGVGEAPLEGREVVDAARRLGESEKARRGSYSSELERSAQAYLVRRGRGGSIVAGYPWFADWGRDTFIAVRGLCLATGRLDEARDILLAWADAVSEGMLPNRFPDVGDEPEFNSADASLWYVVGVHEYLRATRRAGGRRARGDRFTLARAVDAILRGYASGTRFGIRAGSDGLLAAGVPGQQLTWMDAKIGDRVVTPRVGKPVELQALWLNALRIGAETSAEWKAPLRAGLASFGERFWNPDLGCLYDVVDADHRPGAVDAAFRPNQIFAAGGLPFAVLDLPRCRMVVDAVEARLLTPLGLRSLAAGEAGYRPTYVGGPEERDEAYHQGTVWPWLMGPFVEAWVRVRSGTRAAREDARERFLAPLLEHLGVAGLGHISEIADAEAPHAPRGCPFQAWSLAEALRLERVVLAPGPAAAWPAPDDWPPDRGLIEAVPV